LLPKGTWIAVVTGPRQLVVGGWPRPLSEATTILERAGLSCRVAPATRAVHGPITAPAVPAFERAMRELPLMAPTIELYSANTGRPTTAAEATDPEFWSRQLVQPVLFADAVDALTAAPGRLLLIEVGPGQMLTSALRRHPTVLAGRHRLLPTLAHRPTEPQAQTRTALAALAAVWTEGHVVDWAAVGDLADAGRACVPGYPFERTAVGFEPAAAESAVPVTVAVEPAAVAQADRPVVEAQPAEPVTASVQPAPTAEAGRPAEAEPAEPAEAEPAEPAPAAGSGGVAPVPVPARSAKPPGTTDRLRRLWISILGEEEIAPDADFFELGGNSLTAVELMTEVRAEFGVELRTVVLFEHSTLAALAAQIDRRVA
jgi:phthiocerol/phenolphthiocerol synthesis type-I polyketide synthase E